MAGGLSGRRTRQSPHLCFDLHSSRCELAHLPKVYEQRDHDEGHRRSFAHCKVEVEVEGQVGVESSFTAGWLMATRVPASEIPYASHAWVNRADAAEQGRAAYFDAGCMRDDSRHDVLHGFGGTLFATLLHDYFWGPTNSQAGGPRG